MFENYSINDLVANIYKKRKLNSILFISVFLIVSIFLFFRYGKTTITTGGNTQNFSSYVSYKIESPLEEQKSFNKNQIGGYGDFYGKLLEGNLNGAFLFNNVSEVEMKKIASELSTEEVTLKNSNIDYWEKKISVYPLINNAGVSVKIVTPSKELNDLVERKFDDLINKYKETYNNVTISKIDTVKSSQKINDVQNLEVTKVFSGKRVILLIILAIIFSLVITIFINISRYIFNPTINRIDDFNKFTDKFIENIDDEIIEFLKYKAGNSRVALVSTNDTILNKFKFKYENMLEDSFIFTTLVNINEIVEVDKIVFIEELGITRYSNLNNNIRKLKNLNKEVSGIITFDLK